VHEIDVPEDIRLRAARAVERMIEIGSSSGSLRAQAAV
jgi:hypothetical protein